MSYTDGRAGSGHSASGQQDPEMVGPAFVENDEESQLSPWILASAEALSQTKYMFCLLTMS